MDMLMPAEITRNDISKIYECVKSTTDKCSWIHLYVYIRLYSRVSYSGLREMFAM